MKVSINWVKQFVDIDVSTEELVQRVGEQLGAVEEVIAVADKYQGIYIVKVVSTEPHPNADKLTLCQIDDGDKTPDVTRNSEGLVQVVCGAPNVKEGMLAVWLPPGSTLPSSYDSEPFVLEARDLRGETSNGMLASAKELALGDNHDGIVEVDIPTEPGSLFVDTYELDDVVIDIENKMFTHRPDCFGILGVAREIAGIFGKEFISPDWYGKQVPIDEPKKPEVNLRIDNKIPDAVPRFMAVAIDGISVKDSPLIIQTYLARVGIRPINNIVDATNYVMVLTGQPLHAYDLAKLRKLTDKDEVSLEARWSKKGDELTLLDGKKISFDDDKTVLITSHDTPVGIGGVMGGLDTEVDESTSAIVLECANFDMYAIRKASMQHGLFTDAVTRFNKGQSVHQNDRVLKEAVATLEFIGGGRVVSTVNDEGSELAAFSPIRITSDFINVRLGTIIGAEEVKRVLTNVEFKVSADSEALQVTPPFWRTDIEIAEDVVEEVGRLIGFDELPLELPSRSLLPAGRNTLLELNSSLRQTLSAAGGNEVVTYSFVHGNVLDAYQQDTTKAYKITNALSPELQYYRVSLTPSLLEKVHQNIKSGHGEFALYEIGKVHVKDDQDDNEPSLPREQHRLVMVYAADEKAWSRRFGAAYYQARTYLEQLLHQTGINYKLVPLDEVQPPKASSWQQLIAPYDASRSAAVLLGDEPIGIIGELKPSVRKAAKLPVATAAFELDTTKLQGNTRSVTYQPLPKYPKASQDISFKLPAATTYSDVQQVVGESLTAEKNLHTAFVPIDIYQPESDASTKHMAFRITAYSDNKTLTTDELSAILDRVADGVEKELDGERI